MTDTNETATDETKHNAPEILVSEFRREAERASDYDWKDEEIAAALVEVARNLNMDTD